VQSNDVLDRVAHELATTLANTLNLWWGDLAFLVRNFAHDSAIAEHWLPVTTVGPTPPRPHVLHAREAVLALSRPTAEPNEQDFVALGVALSQCNPQPPAGYTPHLRACDADEARKTLLQHLERSWQLGRGEAGARALLDVFASSGHRFWHAPGSTTTIFMATPALERIALISYEGDGP
jgi:hypothetical protein